MTRLGIDIGGTTVKLGIVNDTFEILKEQSIPTGADRSTEAVVADIIAAARPLIAKYAPVTLGVGSPGSIDPNAGVVLRAGNLPFRNVPLAALLEEALGLPVSLENDANCALIAEVTAGVCRGCKDALMITIGTGIGGSILIDGKIYYGHNLLAGELGHFVIHHGGRQCACGMKGCFEQYASATALVRATETAIKEHPGSLLAEAGAGGVDGKTVFTALKQGCPVADGVLSEYLSYLADGLNSLTFIFQPQKIALAGGVANAGDILTERLQPLLGPRTNVALSALKGQSGILGAAMLPVFRSGLPDVAGDSSV